MSHRRVQLDGAPARVLGGWALLALSLVGLLAALDIQPVYACECPSPPPAAAALADSNAVFLGTVVRMRAPQPTLKMRRAFPFFEYSVEPFAPARISLTVQRTWRGPAFRSITLTTGPVYAGCGFPFQEGQTYLVYAYRTGAGVLATHRCSRTAPQAEAAGDIELFGPGVAPTLNGSAEISELIVPLACIVVLLGVGAALFGVRMLRRA